MTTYGTIATSPSRLAPNLEYISRANQRPRSGIATPQPWKKMFNHQLFSPPSTLEDVIGRLRTNLNHFLTNYAIVILFFLFLGLLWHPLALIILTSTIALWLYFYFLRDEQLVIFDHLIDDRMVMIVLLVITIALLLLAGATINVVLSLFLGAVLVLAHAIFRKIGDLFADEESVVSSATHLLVKH